ncbi:uncharacterized protein LOC110821184 isoform X7 [Carica papaya]|uniref:uncharacterized protein LOC110821184 isoform X7 n=1 Tax=Carica papaya TaxID=3649 RepID=UPI000B8CBA48|nr:uncharacterized protein LOC110821184 isoform X7 [Carica papaya]
MQGDEARVLLGFPPNSRPTLSQVKAAYKSKVWESHPDLFPAYEKPLADSKFKLISEAYACLLSVQEGVISMVLRNKLSSSMVFCKRAPGYLHLGKEFQCVKRANLFVLTAK